MRDVSIYDLSDASKRKTIYATSGTLAFAANQRDLVLDLFDGMTLTVPTAQPNQLDRVYFREDRLKVRDVANSFQSVDADTTSKSDREMSICEMQAQYDIAHREAVRARQDSVNAVRESKTVLRHAPPPPKVTPVGGIGAAYCTFVRKYLHVKEAQAAELPPRMRQDTTKRAAAAAGQGGRGGRGGRGGESADSVFVLYNGKYVKVPRNKIPAGAMVPGAAPASQVSPVHAGAAPSPSPNQAAAVMKPPTQAPLLATTPASPSVGNSMAGVDAKMRLDDARYRERRYGIEIQKKFSLAAACIVFVIVGAPIALRFPRGGIGFVFALSFAVFATYYVALQAGEATANRGLISPFWAMWGANVLFAAVGLLMLPQMGSEGVTNRGGSVGELVDATRAWFARRGGDPAAAAISPEVHP
jgi:lipopolysaccharide export system permease protein